MVLHVSIAYINFLFYHQAAGKADIEAANHWLAGSCAIMLRDERL